MFDRVNELSDSLTGGSGGDIDISEDTFVELLRDDERASHVLMGSSVEHETGGRTTTVEPDGDHTVYLIVTDERAIIVFGDEPDTVEIEFEMGSIGRCTVQSSLLNKTLVVDGGDESIRFSPTEGDPEAVEDYVEQASGIHQDVGDALQVATDEFEILESKIRDEGEGSDRWLRIQSKLSEARSRATRDSGKHPLGASEDEMTLDRLLDHVADVEREFQRRYVDVWLEHGEDALEDAKTAFEADDHSEFCERYAATARAVDALQNGPDTFDSVSDEALGRIESLADAVDGYDDEYVEATRETRETARNASDLETAASQWLEVYRRYAAAHEAGWDQAGDLRELSTAAELEGVAEHAVEALVEYAERLEDEGEDRENEDADAARSLYEEASTSLREAQDIARKWASVDGADAFETRLATLDEKIDRTKWEWGAPGEAE